MNKRLILLFTFLIGVLVIQTAMAQGEGGAVEYRPKTPNHPNALPAWTQQLDISTRTASATISGRVTAADGTSPVDRTGSGVQLYDAFTGKFVLGVGLNRDGVSYTFENVPAGTYLVRAKSPNFALQYYNDAGFTPDDATPLVVDEDAVITNIDFALDAGGFVEGTVFGENGATPLPNVPVRVADGVTLLQCTDANGQYTVNSLPLDVPLRLFAGGPSNCDSTSSGEYVVEYWEEAAALANATPITLSAAMTTTSDIDFTLAFGGSIAGIVTNEAKTNRLANILVTAEDATTGEFVRETRTNANGEYTLTGLAGGDYRVRAEGERHVIEYYEEAGFNGNSATIVTVNVQQTTDGIDFTLENGGRIMGRVTTPSGQPLPRINIELSNDIWASTCTDINGNFTLTGVPLGVPLKIYAGGANYCDRDQLFVREWWREADRENGATPIVIPIVTTDVDNINFTLVEGGSLSGTVTRADSGAPITSGVEIVVSERTRPVEVARGIVNADGSYTVSALPAGDYAVFARGNGYALQFYDEAGISLASATPVSIRVNQNTPNIDFDLDPSGNIVGRVRDADSSTPLANVFVAVEGAAWLSTCTDANGRYTLSNIPRDLSVKVYAGAAKCDAAAGDYLREWWNEKTSAAAATPITLTAAQSTQSNTDFTLAKGNRVFLPIVRK